MSDGTLRPLEMNDTPLYGPKGLLVCGLDEDQASQLEHRLCSGDGSSPHPSVSICVHLWLAFGLSARGDRA